MALKGAIRDSYDVLTATRTISSTNALVPGRICLQSTCNSSNVFSRATCRAPRGTKGQLSKIDKSMNRIWFSFFIG